MSENRKQNKVYYLVIPFLVKDVAKSRGKLISKKLNLHSFISETNYSEYVAGNHKWV